MNTLAVTAGLKTNGQLCSFSKAAAVLSGLARLSVIHRKALVLLVPAPNELPQLKHLEATAALVLESKDHKQRDDHLAAACLRMQGESLGGCAHLQQLELQGCEPA
jgi:hypothetical protein